MANKQGKRRLLETIRLAFPPSPYPFDLHIADHGCGECKAIEADFSGKSWNCLSAEMLLRNREVLPLLTPAAYLYFLPAFLTLCISAYRQSDVIPTNIVMSLSAPPNQADGERVESLTKSMNRQQKAAIAEFLVFVETQDVQVGKAARKVLNRGWNRWLLDTTGSR